MEAGEIILLLISLLLACWAVHRWGLWVSPWPDERQWPRHGIDVQALARRLEQLRQTGSFFLSHHSRCTAHQDRIRQAQQSVAARGYFRHHAKDPAAAGEDDLEGRSGPHPRHEHGA
jgi:hypothetical protein